MNYAGLLFFFIMVALIAGCGGGSSSSSRSGIGDSSGIESGGISSDSDSGDVSGTSQEDRDISTPSKALLGHWKCVGGIIPVDSVDLYFGPNGFTQVYENGNSDDFRYVVLSESKQTRELKFKSGKADDSELTGPFTIVFNSDYTEWNYKDTGYSFGNNVYIDSRQSP